MGKATMMQSATLAFLRSFASWSSSQALASFHFFGIRAAKISGSAELLETYRMCAPARPLPWVLRPMDLWFKLKMAMQSACHNASHLARHSHRVLQKPICAPSLRSGGKVLPAVAICCAPLARWGNENLLRVYLESITSLKQNRAKLQENP